MFSPKHKSLLSRPVGRHPQPAVAKVVVDEEDVAFLEAESRDLVLAPVTDTSYKQTNVSSSVSGILV